MNNAKLEDLEQVAQADHEHKKDRRRDPRFATSQPVVLTVLGTKAKPVTEACILNISDHGLRLRVAQPIPAGAIVKVDAREVPLLGEVVRCVPIDGAHHVGVHLFQSLTGAFDLSRLNNRLLLEELLLDSRKPGLVQRALVEMTRKKTA